MYFDFHLTKMNERRRLASQNDFKLVKISPEDVIKVRDKKYFERGKQMVWDENHNDFYEWGSEPLLETLRQFDKNPQILIEKTGFYKSFIDRKGEGYLQERIPSFFQTYQSIKEKGIQNPIIVEQTGERIDGSFRSVIATHLGIKEIPARLFSFKWQDIDKDFILRKLKGHFLGLGRNYYYIEYSSGLSNFPYENKGIYSENAEERWQEIIEPTLSPIIGKRFLDLGCNQGFISIKIAQEEGIVTGIDYISQATSNLNKLIFEFVNKADLPIDFIEADIRDYKIPENYDWTLILNTIYHLPKEDQIPLLKKVKERTKKIILQCNLRKSRERDRYFGSHPDDAISLLEKSGFKNIKRIDWRVKPIIIANS